MKIETFGTRLQRLRKKRGMSRECLAQKANITLKCLKSLEGDIPVFPDVIQRLASALDTTVEYLKTGDDPIITQSLQNLEVYIKNEAIDDKAAEELRDRVVKKITRTSVPLSDLDFEALREYRSLGRIGSEPCYRCGRTYRGSRCPYCGSFGGDPD